MPTHDSTRARRRGSVLVVTLLLSIFIGIALGGYLGVSTYTMRLAHRSFLANSAMNLAEMGIERAMYCFNEVSSSSLATAWNGWTISTGNATRTFTVSVGGAEGTIKVYVENYAGVSGTPKIVAKAIVNAPNGPPIEKNIEVTLSKRSLWGFGLVAKNSVTFDSSGYVDSWISDPDNNPATAAVPYSAGVARANGSVGVVASGNGQLNLRDSPTVYGTANTGGGTVSKSGSAALSGTVGTRVWDSTRIHRDFVFTFPPITVPSGSSVNPVNASITSNTTLPRVGDVAASDGIYYYSFASGRNIRLGAATLTINAPCVLKLQSHSGVEAISTSDHATFTLGTNGTVAIYTNGDINIDSDSLFFANRDPGKCQIYGTNPTSQRFIFRGAVKMNACVYEPFGAINIDSNTVISGSLIGLSIAWGSSAKLHYDESLAGASGNNTQRVTRWKELRTPAEIGAYAAQFAF